MLSTTDMKYFIDPAPTVAQGAKRVFVTKVRYDRNHPVMHTVVAVKDTIIDGGRLWYITLDGTYVSGPPAGDTSQPLYGYAIAPVAGGFALGELNRYSGRADVRLLTSSRFSTGVKLPRNTTVPVKDWIPAADWAYSYMPYEQDADEVVQAKLAVAKRMWEVRNAKIEIIQQGLARQWSKDLKELEESGMLPKARFASFVRGSALVSVEKRPELNEYEQASVDVLDKCKVRTPGGGNSFVSVPVAFFHTEGDGTMDEAKAPTTNTLLRTLRQVTGASNVYLGQYTAVPILSGTN